MLVEHWERVTLMVRLVLPLREGLPVGEREGVREEESAGEAVVLALPVPSEVREREREEEVEGLEEAVLQPLGEMLALRLREGVVEAVEEVEPLPHALGEEVAVVRLLVTVEEADTVLQMVAVRVGATTVRVALEVALGEGEREGVMLPVGDTRGLALALEQWEGEGDWEGEGVSVPLSVPLPELV